MRTIERRLAAIEARLASQRPPAPAGLPEQLAWIEFTTNDELDQLERLFSLLVARGREELTAEEERAYLAIYAAALARQLAGWPTHHEDGERYRALERARSSWGAQ